MHQEIRTFLAGVKLKYPEYFDGKNVLEAGSLNINGSPREFFEGCDYCGVDIGEGPGVDIITPIHQLLNPNQLEETKKYGRLRDVVVSTEMLEHDSNWQKSLATMVELVKPGGLLIITCAGPKREEHGTVNTDTYSSPYTTDYYRNISKEDFLSVVDINQFREYALFYARDEQDLLFYGIKEFKKPAAEPSVTQRQAFIETAQTSNNLPITVCIPTKNRYNGLQLTLLSLALQKQAPGEIIIVDDSDKVADLREDVNYMYIFRLMTERNIDWKVVFGAKMGQHFSHQKVQETAKYDLIFRIDDDEIAEPDVLANLYLKMTKGVGAVAPAVLMPNPSPLPEGLENNITPTMSEPNIQWFRFNGVKECQHLYSCFLYRKGIVDYDLKLSTVCHREETIFTHSMYRAGYKLLADGNSVVWHFRNPEGGIRTFRDGSLWEGDEAIFRQYLKDWGFDINQKKVIVLDCGLGDHYALKSVLPEITAVHPEITIAACFPEVFEDNGVPLISIAEAKQLFGNIDRFQVYKWMQDHGWKGTLAEAFKQMYI